MKKNSGHTTGDGMSGGRRKDADAAMRSNGVPAGSGRAERADVVVVGAGASGLACAITAARAGGRVLVLEADGQIGRSIRRTGNGRCNIANAFTGAVDYRNGRFVARAFGACTPEDALAFLESCGIIMRVEDQGRMYPQANKASSVVDALAASSREAGVQVRPSSRAVSVVCEQEGYAVRVAETTGDTGPGRHGERKAGGGRGGAKASGAHGKRSMPSKAQAGEPVAARGSERAAALGRQGYLIRCRSLVLCTGGGLTDGLLPEDVGLVPFQPVLGPLACDPGPLRGLDKVRAKCALSCRGFREAGEVTFRTYGVSGIAAFNLSRIAQPGDELTIDFLPEMAKSNLAPFDPATDGVTQRFLRDRLELLGPCDWRRFCTGMLLPLVARAVLRAAGLREDDSARKDDLPAFGAALRAFPLTVRGIGDAKLCQVHRGGIDVAAVDPATMQLEGHPGLFACGEALDVDGPCGGFNLHWAWMSGIIAGKAAAAR